MKGLWIHPRDGRAFYRTRKGGKVKLIPLPDLPRDHPDFIAAWAEAARDGQPKAKPAAGTLASTWNAFRASDLYASWTGVYRQKIERQFNAICTRAGHVSARAIRDAHITKDVSDAPSPGDRLRAWRAWGAWCKEKGLLTDDPARTVRMPRMAKAKGEIGHRRWTVEEKSRFRARWPIGTIPRAMFEFLHYHGCRISDACRLGPQHIDADGVLVITQGKTGDRAYTAWSCPLPDYIDPQDHTLMLAAIAPFAGQLLFLPAADGRARSVKAATQMMLKACAAAEVSATSHGLRKDRAASIIERGGSTVAAAAWTGHQTRKMAEHYQREHDRKAAVMGASRNRQDTDLETGSPKSGNAPS